LVCIFCTNLMRADFTGLPILCGLRADRTSAPAWPVPHWNPPAHGSGFPPSTGSAQALQRSWSRVRGEDQPAPGCRGQPAFTRRRGQNASATRTLRAQHSQTLPSGRGLGKPGFPMSQPLLGAAGAPQAGARFDKLTTGGETRFPRMFTSVIHAAAPHSDTMNIGFSWEGYALPNPPLREGVGETRFPHVPTAGGSGWRPTGRGMLNTYPRARICSALAFGVE